ncbi:RelA/SpoT family protein [Xylocopilactobacillus apicola]|uniref:GTP diphosphokinase n=1 Tax=Xylocopilactobacillus apicola TaxID=2932184 RepID=A0AAU9D2Y3_9LACO|nr:bifunctional (p)ppGpp synthetase/guanosine-3',5'-bis(diphosphate) 3'-pyrophosphohydrolase [Xylocopilactobacillus apicola]BDR58119.1 GTP pyrophosphokinase [Xylocopilactobacillus apicola]
MVKTKNFTIDDVIKMCQSYMNDEHVATVKKAYEFAEYVHHDQYRKSGEAYIIHPIQVAGILAELKMDPDTVSSGFLHDVVEDTQVTGGDIEVIFGSDIAYIVDGLTKLSKVKYVAHKDELAENHRKMLLAMAKDLRIIMVKLADRLHNMRTLEYLPSDRQQAISNETLEIFAPLADRLGISAIKWELEDLSFLYLKPKEYHKIASLMDTKRGEREGYIEEAVTAVNRALLDLNLDYEIYGRPKHIYSIYKKMVSKNKQFDELYDLLALRVITKTVQDCYAVLGAVHTEWLPIPGRFKDYIASPKKNLYQSLHTTVIGPGAKPLEIQIRTEKMHEIAEFGVAAHWAYKEGETDQVKIDATGKKLDLFREILEIQSESEDVDAHDFMATVKGDLFSDRVYVFTPKGDVYDLPKGSVPLDFAYLVHTEVGNHAIGAKRNGKIITLDTPLKNGDILEIMTATQAKPSRDWVDFVKTTRARNKIKRYFKNQEKDEDIEAGRQMLENYLIDNKFDPKKFLTKESLAKIEDKFKGFGANEILAAIGYGELSAQGVANRLTEDYRKQQAKEKQDQDLAKMLEPSKSSRPVNSIDEDTGVYIAGVDNLLVHLARCCTPIPGDPIVGYVTQGRGVTVHRADCHNVTNNHDVEQRLIEVFWGDPDNRTRLYATDLEIYGYNRNGVLKDVVQELNVLAKGLGNISAKVSSDDKTATIEATVKIYNKESLRRIMESLKKVPDVYNVVRANK